MKGQQQELNIKQQSLQDHQNDLAKYDWVKVRDSLFTLNLVLTHVLVLALPSRNR